LHSDPGLCPTEGRGSAPTPRRARRAPGGPRPAAGGGRWGEYHAVNKLDKGYRWVGTKSVWNGCLYLWKSACSCPIILTLTMVVWGCGSTWGPVDGRGGGALAFALAAGARDIAWRRGRPAGGNCVHTTQGGVAHILWWPMRALIPGFKQHLT